MFDLSEIDPNDKSPLENAWEYFADVVFPGFNYRDDLKMLRDRAQQGTWEDASEIYRQLKNRELSLKRQFLSLLNQGYFIAFGYSLNDDGDPGGKKKINQSLFDERLSGWLIDWDENWIEYQGRRFLGIDVVPNFQKLREEFPERFSESMGSSERSIPTSTDQYTERSGANHPQKPGAKSLEHLRQEVITHCDKAFGDFFEWSNRKQLIQVRKTAKELLKDKYDGRGFGRTAYFESRKMYQQKQ